MNAEMISEIRTAMRRIKDKNNVRLLIIGGKGKSFSSGADLNYMHKQAKMTEKENYEDSLKLGSLFFEIYSFPKPVITVSLGNIAGGANGIIAASDFALTSNDAVFRFSEVNLGLVPATIAPYVLDRIGRSRCMELMLTGRTFSGSEAEKFGLVNRSVEGEETEKELQKILNLFRKAAPDALKKTKKLILDLNESDQKEKLIKKTSSIIAEARASAEGQEGLVAFFEKRKANWVNEDI
jgi:methylglutaconyl-CoA hydratase